MENRSCANCGYGSADEPGDLICTNAESEFCADWVCGNHSCPEWEEKAK